MIALHGFSMSPNTRRALVALEECNEAYTFVPVDLMSGEQRGDAYKALNPTGRVPTLVEGDFHLWESNAIVAFLAARFPDRLCAGTTPEERGDIARWCFMATSHLSPSVARIFAHTIRLPEDQRIPKVVDEARAEIPRCLEPLDRHLQGREYIGKSFGVADLALAPSLAFAPMLGISFDSWPNLRAWLERIAARPSWKKVYA